MTAGERHFLDRYGPKLAFIGVEEMFVYGEKEK